MLEVVHKAHVPDLQTQAPGTRIAQRAEVVKGGSSTPGIRAAVAQHGGEVAVGGNGRHALGTVFGVAVVARTIPAEDAGHAPVHLVFHQSLGQPALALGAAAFSGHGHAVIAALPCVVTAHALHITVVEVHFDVQRIPGGDGERQAGPEHGTIGLAGVAEAARIIIEARIGRQGVIGIAVGKAFRIVCEFCGILTLHAEHGPGGDFKTVQRHRDHQAKKVHVVKVVALVIAVIGDAHVIVVEGAHPERGQANSLIELVGGHHARHRSIHNCGTAGLVGQNDLMQAHAHLEIGLGHHPVNIGLTDPDLIGTVRPESPTGFCVAPFLIADLELDRTGQGFRGHRIQLQADTLTRAERIIVVDFRFSSQIPCMADEVVVAHAEAHQPLPLGLEVDGRRARGRAQQHARCQQQCQNLFHLPPSFLLQLPG